MKKKAHNVKIVVNMKRCKSRSYISYLLVYQPLTQIRLGDVNRSLPIIYKQTNGVKGHPTRLSQTGVLRKTYK